MSDSQTFDTVSDEEKFFDKFADALALVRAINPALGKMIARLGAPLIDETIPTAQVRLDMDRKAIEFAINPEFYLALDDETAAAVITHESYHVLLNHLSEVGDRENYPDLESLVVAHECLANDSLMGSTGLDPKQNPHRGMELFGLDFSYLTTPEAYAIVTESNESEEDSNDDSSEPQDNAESDEENDSSDEESESGSDEESNDEGDPESESDASTDPESGDESEGNSESPADEGETDESSENSTNAGSFCGGVKVIGEGEPDQSAINEALRAVLSEAMDDVAIEELPQEAQNALESLADKGVIEAPEYDNTFTKDGYSRIDEVRSMNVRWVDLLAKINPKIKSSGKPKRVKDSWHAPNRRLMSVYPQVILPTRQRPQSESGKKGDAVPSFVIALDMSPSIPTELLGDLAAFATSIPEKLIKAYPITWSSTYRVFDPKNPHLIVNRELTYVSSVKAYADTIEKETGNRPYVLVITDGWFSDAYRIPQDEALSHWWFMGIKPEDKAAIVSNVGVRTTDDRVFNLRDFTS